MRILVDTQGGDHSPQAMVKGAQIAVEQIDDLEIVLLGNEEEIKTHLMDEKNISIVETQDIISNYDDPALSIRKKKDSSIVKACNMMNSGEGDCFLSAGSTGALLAAGMLIVKRIDKFQRATIPTILPGVRKKVVLVDSGANVDCTEEMLYEFAKLGVKYSELILKTRNPKVALVSNGEEDSKGNELTKKANQLFRKSGLNFIGNIESRDILISDADVLVQDGFVANIILKEMEGMKDVFSHLLKTYVLNDEKHFNSDSDKVEFLSNFAKGFDVSGVGGAPILGVKKPIIKAHGNSDYKTFSKAIEFAYNYTKSGLIEVLEEK